tara:strand:- start:649 stop:1263 length:615 start_codon:yes stop_codon:yes gene_type:complete
LAESLSLVLPVHNVQTELQRSVAVLLDVLPELTRDFEILIVDDHSTDSTEEVAYELTRAYPQVRLLRHTRPLGGEVSVETGLARAVGEVVIVLFDLQSSVEKLRHLWEQRAEPTPTIPSPGQVALAPGLIHRLFTWGRSLQEPDSAPTESPSVTMLRRAGASRQPDHVSESIDAHRVHAELVTHAGRAADHAGFLSRIKRMTVG